jgi:hypothetical protein
MEVADHVHDAVTLLSGEKPPVPTHQVTRRPSLKAEVVLQVAG